MRGCRNVPLGREGERVLECTASGALVTVGPRVAQGASPAPRQQRAGGARGGTEGSGMGGGGRCPPWGGLVRSGAAPDRQTGGAADVLGGGAVCTMAYPGHPGAGGGYYPGGVSAERGHRSLAAPGARGRQGRTGGGAAGGSPSQMLPARTSGS